MTLADIIANKDIAMIVEFTLYLQDVGGSYAFIKSAFANPDAEAELEFQNFLKYNY